MKKETRDYMIITAAFILTGLFAGFIIGALTKPSIGICIFLGIPILRPLVNTEKLAYVSKLPVLEGIYDAVALSTILVFVKYFISI